MHHLVVGALQKGRVDGAEGPKALGGEAGGEGHRVLLGDAHVEAALRKALGHQIEPGARRHRRRDRHDPVVRLGLPHQRLGKDRGVGGRVGLSFLLGAGGDVELADAVIFVVRGLGRRIAFSFLRDDVDQDGAAVVVVPDVLQHRDQMVEIVPVERAQVIKAQLLEERRAARGQDAGILLRPLRRLLDAPREVGAELLGHVAEAAIGVRGDDAREIGAHRPRGRGDRHVVVVEDDDQPAAGRGRVVHGLVRHAGTHRPVADDADDVAPRALEPRRRRHAEPGRDRGRAVRRAERVVDALRPPREAREPPGLPERPDAPPPAGQDLVRVGLVPDIPDQPVIGRLEHAVQRHRQLHHPQPRPEMPPRHRDRIDHLRTKLVRQLAKLIRRKRPQIGRLPNAVQKRRAGHGLKRTPPSEPTGVMLAD